MTKSCYVWSVIYYDENIDESYVDTTYVSRDIMQLDFKNTLICYMMCWGHSDKLSQIDVMVKTFVETRHLKVGDRTYILSYNRLNRNYEKDLPDTCQEYMF